MSQRFAFQMAFQAGDIGFSGDLRQIKAVFHPRDVDPLGRSFAVTIRLARTIPSRVLVLHLFTGNVQRIAFDTVFGSARPLYFNNVN